MAQMLDIAAKAPAEKAAQALGIFSSTARKL